MEKFTIPSTVADSSHSITVPVVLIGIAAFAVLIFWVVYFVKKTQGEKGTDFWMPVIGATLMVVAIGGIFGSTALALGSDSYRAKTVSETQKSFQKHGLNLTNQQAEDVRQGLRNTSVDFIVGNKQVTSTWVIPDVLDSSTGRFAVTVKTITPSTEDAK